MPSSGWWSGDYPITQPFGCTGFALEPPAKSSWGYGNCPHFHTGVDIGMPAGTPLRAGDSGVVSTGFDPAYGNWMRITQTNRGGSNSIYLGHLDQIFVKNGQQVSAGQAIATSGATGNVTGAHLHFEQDVSGRPVDPAALFGAIGPGPNPVADAVNAALGPVGSAITDTTNTLIEKATYGLILGIGALLMLAGFAVLILPFVGRGAASAASLSPGVQAQKAVNTAEQPKPAAAPPQSGISNRQRSRRLAEYGAGPDLETRQNGKPTGKLRPSVREKVASGQ